jgi:class 3 adenylate cyclase
VRQGLPSSTDRGQNRVVPQSLRTHVMTDIRHYSRIVEDEGEAHAVRVMRMYERLVRAALPRKTCEADHIGDGFHLVFPTPTQALRTAVAIADELQRHNALHPDLQIPVAFGIDSGQGARQGSHFVGSAPVVATRLARRAKPGQVLVAEATFALVRASKPGTMRDLGVWQPSGGQAVHVYEARAADAQVDGSREPERFLRALLFEDIVGSTAMSAKVGARRWVQLVEEHHAIVRDELRRHGGMEVDTAGDGFYAAFEVPSRAVDCALAIRKRMQAIGMDVRAGIHAGECGIVAGKIGGLTVTVGARVGAKAEAGEVLVSQTVKDLLLGSPYVFTDRGAAALKGVPGSWTLYEVDAPASS